jgi:hypothetical protein
MRGFDAFESGGRAAVEDMTAALAGVGADVYQRLSSPGTTAPLMAKVSSRLASLEHSLSQWMPLG